jgi:putative hydrolase of HD superfamily
MSTFSINATVHFFYELGQQLEVKRSGWRLIGASCHIARAAQIGFILAVMEKYSRPEEVATALLFHDLPETRTGDPDKLMARYVTVDEVRALEEQTEGLGKVGGVIRSYWHAVENRGTQLGRIAKDADYLECAVRARELEETGHKFATDWTSNVKGALVTESAKALFAEILSTHPHTWWRGLKKLS